MDIFWCIEITTRRHRE